MRLRFRLANFKMLVDQHAYQVLKKCENIRENGEFCDVELIVGHEKRKITAHRLILAAASEFFAAMFAERRFLESNSREVQIDVEAVDIFEAIIRFCYTSKIQICDENVQQLLETANHFRVMDLAQSCCEYLVKEMEPDNCLGVFHLADHLGLNELAEITLEFVCDNFTGVAQSEEFFQLSVQGLTELLKSDNLVVRSETEVFLAVISWIQHDPKNRRFDASDLLRHIRVTHLDPKFLLEQVAGLDLTAEAIVSVSEVVTFMTEGGEAPLPYCLNTRKYYDLEGVIAIGSEEGSTNIEFYDPTTDEWTLVETLPERVFFGATRLGDSLIIAGGCISGNVIDSVSHPN